MKPIDLESWVYQSDSNTIKDFLKELNNKANSFGIQIEFHKQVESLIEWDFKESIEKLKWFTAFIIKYYERRLSVGIATNVNESDYIYFLETWVKSTDGDIFSRNTLSTIIDCSYDRLKFLKDIANTGGEIKIPNKDNSKIINKLKQHNLATNESIKLTPNIICEVKIWDRIGFNPKKMANKIILNKGE